MTADKVRMAARLMKDLEVSIQEICKTLGMSRSTLYRYVAPDVQVRQS